MSHLFIKTLCQAQAARSFSGRLLSSNIGVKQRVVIAPEPNDLKGAGLTQGHKMLGLDYLDQPHITINNLTTHSTLANPVLFTKDIGKLDKVGSSDIKSDDVASHKVLSSRIGVDKADKASLEQLSYVADYLTRALPHFFTSPHPIQLYSKDVLLIDKIRNVQTKGIGSYNLQVALVKVYYALNYSGNRVELLNLVKDPEESCIKIRWRIVCKPGLIRLMLFFYKFNEHWRDAISTMYVNKEGKIYCHVCDNIDVEKDGGRVKKVVKNPLVNRGIHV